MKDKVVEIINSDIFLKSQLEIGNIIIGQLQLSYNTPPHVEIIPSFNFKGACSSKHRDKISGKLRQAGFFYDYGNGVYITKKCFTRPYNLNEQ